VNRIRYHVTLEGLPGFQADAVLGEAVFEVLVDPRDLRQFRASLLDLARISGSHRQWRGILILDEPQISDERLAEEWSGIQSLFRPEILERITLVIRRATVLDQVYGHLSDEERESIGAIAEHERHLALRPSRRPAEAFFDILRVLLIHWFRRSGPLTSKELAQQTGFTYPTIASALERLEPHLLRHSNRSIELQSFPRDEWFKLVAQGEKARASQGYTDRSGRPRSPEALLDRLRELGREDISVAGVHGARFYHPGLDLVGSPRLDLVVHAHGMAEPASFLRRLDPALVPAERGEPCQVVVHTLFRSESFSIVAPDGLRWADEVECLLDLHEARLEPQALDFLECLVSKAGGSAKILVVEDVPEVANILMTLLKQFGYKAVIAGDGSIALSLYADGLGSDDPFDLVLLDMSLPGVIREMDVFRKIREMDPRSRVIASSGYFSDTDALLEQGFVGLLAKPFRSHDLERAVRDGLSPTVIRSRA
jgi:CheY-like chemotaxis protein